MGEGAGGLRVVQWATGNIGTRAMRAVIEHPAMSLVGVWVHSPGKAGRDAGELCGLAPVGVPATSDVDEIVGLGADCVLYMPQGCDVGVLGRLLESGSNIVTTRGEFHHPSGLPTDSRAAIDDACTRGGSSLYSTGSSPGFISEAVPLALLSLQRRFGRLVIDEFADLSRRNSPELLFSLMGFGREPAAFDRRRWAHGAASFGPTLRMLAGSIGLPLDTVEATGDVALATRDVSIAAGEVAAGTVAAQRMVVTGFREGSPLLEFRATWYCSAELDKDWPLQDTGWRLRLDGDSPMDVSIRFEVPIEKMAEASPAFTANRAVNAVPAVCAAAPGVRTTVDLPQIVPFLGSL